MNMQLAPSLLTILLAALHVHEAHANCHDEYVEMVQHGHTCARAFLHSDKEATASCKGLRIDIVQPEASSLPPGFKHAISSMVISPGCMVKVWDEDNYTGASRAFYAGKHASLMDVTRWVGWWSGNWNDKIASLKCTCDINEVDIKSG